MIRMFGVPVTRKQVVFVLADIGVLALSAFVAIGLRLGPENVLVFVMKKTPTFLLQGFIFIACFMVAEVYDVKKDYRRIEHVLQLLAACAVGVVISMVLFSSRFAWLGRGILTLQSVFIFLLASLMRSVYTGLQSRQQLMKRVLLVGAGDSAKKLLDEILARPNYDLWVEGFIDDGPEKQGMRIGKKPVLGTTLDLMRVVAEYRIDQVVLCANYKEDKELVKVLLRCHYNHIDITDMPTVYESITGKLPLSDISDEWLLYSVMSKHRFLYKNLKRLLDVALALVLLVLSSPVMLISMLIIRLDSRGGIFFRQERLGQNYGKFTLYKFRTMVQDAEEATGAVWAVKNDKRVTRVGRYLRKLRIDEIPQLINVIKGDMSFVGPRPEREVFVRELEKETPAYVYRLFVKPGLTGWAQVKYAYASTAEESKEKLRYDLYYVKNMSFMLDILVVIKTVKVVLFLKGH